MHTHPRGVSVFYGAQSEEVAIAEVRPPVGSFVVVAQFQLLRFLNLLDLSMFSNLDAHGSIFDREYNQQLNHNVFLKELARKIATPVVPEDEAFEYIPTQAIADYLASRNAPKIDGILYPSIQAKGEALNIALFNNYSRVETLDLARSQTLKMNYTMDGIHGFCKNYSLPDVINSKKNEDDNNDNRPLTLRIVFESIKIHEIKSAKFETSAQQVLYNLLPF